LDVLGIGAVALVGLAAANSSAMATTSGSSCGRGCACQWWCYAGWWRVALSSKRHRSTPGGVAGPVVHWRHAEPGGGCDATSTSGHMTVEGASCIKQGVLYSCHSSTRTQRPMHSCAVLDVADAVGSLGGVPVASPHGACHRGASLMVLPRAQGPTPPPRHMAEIFHACIFTCIPQR
jgi:hypothetical protein